MTPAIHAVRSRMSAQDVAVSQACGSPMRTTEAMSDRTIDVPTAAPRQSNTPGTRWLRPITAARDEHQK